jgi:putative oxidoreductase
MPDLQQSFDLTNGFNILRIVCGLYFIPHIWAAFYVPQAIDVFVKNGFRPPAFWLYASAALECVFAVGLTFGIFVHWIAALAAIHLTIAAIAVFRLSERKWLWNIGGCEFPLFWAITCAVVAVHG